MYILNHQFEWNDKKAIQNKEKHGITFEQAAGAFFDPDAFIELDTEHSHHEARFICLGKPIDNIIIVIIFTIRRNSDGSEKIRFISARKASKKERKIYEGQ